MNELLRASGVFESIDVHFADWLARKGAHPHTQLAGALASRAVRRGHVCVALDGLVLLDPEGELAVGLQLPSDWSAVRSDPLVGGAETTESTPLVWVEGRVYLARYYEHEVRLAAALTARAVKVPVDVVALTDGLEKLFPGRVPASSDQQAACRVAVSHRLAVISGGPGTGKTHTVARLLALLVQQYHRNGRSCRVRLLAPTGKAAARMIEALDEQRTALDPAFTVDLPTRASTVHRALSAIGGSRTRYRHNRSNPLPDDVVVVDEASMVDLAMMRRLVEAVRPESHLILLGDRHQLASVESGAVLGEIASGADAHPDSALASCVSTLRHSFRFRSGGGIGELADAIRLGDGVRALEVLSRGGEVSLMARPAPGGFGARSLSGPLAREVVNGFRPLLDANTTAEAVEALGRFRVLCAHRTGPWGLEGLNPQIERLLSKHGLDPSSTWYPRRPVLVRSNDYRQELFNGDQGVAMLTEEGLRVWFAGVPVRGLAPSRLVDVETVFALSIHKSQGSEFDHVVVVLPEATSPLLSRELLYTAVTRAKSKVTIVGEPEVVTAAIERPVRRESGLATRLFS